MPARHTPKQPPRRLEMGWAIIVLAAIVFLSIRGAIVPALALVPLLPRSDFHRAKPK
jgi:hypothetical protein